MIVTLLLSLSLGWSIAWPSAAEFLKITFVNAVPEQVTV